MHYASTLMQRDIDTGKFLHTNIFSLIIRIDKHSNLKSHLIHEKYHHHEELVDFQRKDIK